MAYTGTGGGSESMMNHDTDLSQPDYIQGGVPDWLATQLDPEVCYCLLYTHSYMHTSRAHQAAAPCIHTCYMPASLHVGTGECSGGGV